MKIPKTIKVGAMRYTVELTDELLDGGRAVGQTSTSAGVLKISKNQCRQQQESTFIHELLHVAYDRAGLRSHFEEHIEEKMVAPLANALYDILAQSNLLK